MRRVLVLLPGRDREGGSVNNGNWIKLNRRILDWGWYGDINTKTIFIHCLLMANWSAGEWKGIHYEAGEFVTSLPKLCEETGLTTRQVRTALTHLEKTQEVTCRTTDRTTGRTLAKNRIISINKWNEYQGSDSQNDRQNDRQATDKRQASDRQIKKEKKEKKERNILSRARARVRDPYHNTEQKDMDELERKLLATN